MLGLVVLVLVLVLVIGVGVIALGVPTFAVLHFISVYMRYGATEPFYRELTGPWGIALVLPVLLVTAGWAFRRSRRRRR